jgi:hypothetical protein
MGARLSVLNAVVTPPLTLLYVRVYTFYSYGKHLHDHMTSIRREVWTHKTSLVPPLFMVPNQESGRSYRSEVLIVALF